jgi:hypothetical protein
MHDIRASVEVRTLIGAGHLRQLNENASAQYESWQCGGEGRATEPTSIIVLAYRVFRVVKLAHAACADSQIIEVGTAAMRAVAERTTARQHDQQIRGAGGQLCCAENHPAKKRPA